MGKTRRMPDFVKKTSLIAWYIAVISTIALILQIIEALSSK